MNCVKCGNPLEEGRDYCGQCGHNHRQSTPENQATCPQCAAPILAGQNFCPSCGTPLTNTSNNATITISKKQIEEKNENAPHQTTPKKKNRQYVFVIIALLVIGLGGFTGYIIAKSRTSSSNQQTSRSIAANKTEAPKETEPIEDQSKETNTTNKKTTVDIAASENKTPPPLQQSATVVPPANKAQTTAAAVLSKSDYIFPNSNSQYLTVDQIKDLTNAELKIARNEIYARHGRLFQSEDIQNYFNSKSWYVGHIQPDKFSDKILNDYEIKNLELIVKAEGTTQ